MLHTLHPLRVFLCHSSGDKLAVRQLYQQLRDNGFNPWLDEENLLPGQDWHHEITKAVHDSDVVLVCLSKDSITKSGYVQREIKFALDVADNQPPGTIFIIPLKLEECEVPERLKKWQWVNLFEARGYERLLKSLQLRAALPISSNEQSLPPVPINEKPKQSESHENIHASARKSMLSGASIKILLALIPVIGSLIAAYWQFVYKPSQQSSRQEIKYTGRVTDYATNRPIYNAKVSIEEDQQVPQIQRTDSEGIFHVVVSGLTMSARIRVEADNYEMVEKHVPLTRTGIDPIALKPINTPKVMLTPSPTLQHTPDTESRDSNKRPSPVRLVPKPPKKPNCTVEQILAGKC